MQIGPLRTRINFLTPSTARNSDGQYSQSGTPTEYARVWAEVRGMTGRQLALAQANTQTATATHAITIRWRNDIKPTHLIQLISVVPDTGLANLSTQDFEYMTVEQMETLETTATQTTTRNFRINTLLDPDGRRKFLTIIATEVQA